MGQEYDKKGKKGGILHPIANSPFRVYFLPFLQLALLSMTMDWAMGRHGKGYEILTVKKAGNWGEWKDEPKWWGNWPIFSATLALFLGFCIFFFFNNFVHFYQFGGFPYVSPPPLKINQPSNSQSKIGDCVQTMDGLGNHAYGPINGCGEGDGKGGEGSWQTTRLIVFLLQSKMGEQTNLSKDAKISWQNNTNPTLKSFSSIPKGHCKIPQFNILFFS